MTLSVVYSGSNSVGTTEFSLTNNSTTIATRSTSGIYRIHLDLSNMDYGDEYILYVKEKVYSSGTQKIITSRMFKGKQSVPFVSIDYALLHGWDFSIKKLAGTDRTIIHAILSNGITPTQAYVNNGVSIGSTEYSLTNYSTSVATRSTAGAYQLILDASNVAFGDNFLVKVLEKVRSADSQQKLQSYNLFIEESEPIVIPFVPLLNGWDFTVTKIAGTNRNFDWSIRAIS